MATTGNELERLYERFNARDIDAVLEMLTPDVDWPNGWEGGYLRGRDEVRAYWTRQWAEIDATVIPQAFATTPDGRIDVTVHQVVKDRDGRCSATPRCITFTGSATAGSRTWRSELPKGAWPL